MRSALEGVEGVVKVAVDFEKKEATVKAKPTVTEEDLLKAVKKAGFEGKVKKDEKKPDEHKGHGH
ncbi:MAG: hypothetical protein A2Z34_00440 [Planctomycetes bacterium RBG_16_59_8]|nr:MAG: hypothetical protein A2Z34_00440 [Planctomycetes bacterium RBG_16_59_8]